MDNLALHKLRQRVAGRTVGIMSHGASICELKEKIQRFRPFNICWASFNYYPIMNTKILIEIDRKLDVVLECAAGRTKEFETSIRMPRIVQYISIGTLILSTWRLLKTQYEQMSISHLSESLLENNIVLCDDILGRLNVPNSLSLLIYTMAIAEPKRIVLFGVDGYKKEQGDEFSTYFMSEQQREYRKALLGGKLEYTLHETTDDFQRDFMEGYNSYCKELNVTPPEIINCSPGTHFKGIPWTDYEKLLTTDL